MRLDQFDLNEVRKAMDEPSPKPSSRRPSQVEMTALQVRANRASSDKEILEASLKIAQEENERLGTSVESLEQEKKTLEKNVASLEEKNAESIQKLEALEAQLSNTSEKSVQLSTKLEQQNTEAIEHKEEMSRLETSLAQVTEQNSSLETKVSTLEEEMSALQGTVESMISEKENLVKAKDDLRIQVNAQEEEKTSLQEKLQQTEVSSAADKKDLEATIAELKDQADAQMEENQALHDSLEKALTFEAELTSTKKADQEKAQKIADMSGDLDGTSRDKAKLQSDYDRLSADIDTLQQQHNDIVAERDALKASLEGKEKELKDAENSAAAARRVVAKLEFAKLESQVAADKENSKGKVDPATTTKSVPRKVNPKPAETPVASKAEPTVLKKSSKADSNVAEKSLAPTAAAVQKEEISELPGMAAEDDSPIQEFRKYKKRSYIKRALHNRYSISTEEKIQQRKDRQKTRESHKGMKQFFLGKRAPNKDSQASA